MTDKKKEYLSVLGLLLAALLWGVSYPLTKVVEDCPTFYIVSIRFLVAAAALALIFHRHFRNFHKEILKYAFLLSFCITSMYIFGTIGIKYTTSVRASFFTCLSFVIIPILNLVIYKLKLNKTIVISVLICLAGMFLLSYTADMGTFSLNAGDLLCILAATAGSLHIIFLDRVTKQENMEPILFTIFLMAFVALWSTLIALATGAFAYAGTSSFQFGSIIALGLFCSAAAFLLQSICQKYVPSNRVGVIIAMEPASGCVISVIVLGEAMHWTGWLGALLVMVSLLYMEISSGRSNA
ncbi:EamA family transporter [Emergencia timonensis]|uniref:DMT family transporter n=1 Tax=Emergencia timonensis TaxID=1776384 RepID=UPI00082A723D|nr:EamA family transporter [Emergencia timonensis]WNX87377.1 EamA family transporter [Emergencia timonensis]